MICVSRSHVDDPINILNFEKFQKTVFVPELSEIKIFPQLTHMTIFKNISSLVDQCVKLVKPKNKDAMASVDWRLIAMCVWQ